MWTTGQPSLCRVGGWEDSSSVSSLRYLSKSVRVRSAPWAATFQSRTSIGPGTAPIQASLLFSPPIAISDARSELGTAIVVWKAALTYLFRNR